MGILPRAPLRNSQAAPALPPIRHGLADAAALGSEPAAAGAEAGSASAPALFAEEGA